MFMSTAAATDALSVRYLDVTAGADGQRLDNFLITQLKGAPKTLVYRIIRKGEVRVNKKRAKADTRLQAGDQVRVPPIRLTEKAADTPVGNSLRELLLGEAVCFENDAVLVLNKPAGLAVHGGSGVRVGLIEALRQVRPELDFLELVHRLDKDTSGCILLAKSRKALNILQDQLRGKKMGKFYQAWVIGQWPVELREVNAPIDRASSPSGERLMRIAAEGEGKRSLTRFRVLKRAGNLTLIEAEPVTGRTHQIRVHARFAGFPLLGDPKYGDEATNERFRKTGISRMFLHARRLVFNDPMTGEPVQVEANADTSWKQVEQQAG
ncbi:23S rRNA pseudouridine955/2504/2580 synthase [Marinospirillum alkaliphilum DSM 21637]|uniref:Pseudouridine synthase n=2 Tax=Marinospirillum TaxID=64968 RepID=A0A1K1X703_9GAMM|nr:23S rRNA pseudouridine955/2504/2580 synthase [Marinospirillum alkaliphilum DSM 21637]